MIGLIVFPVYYLILFVIVWSILNSVLSGLIFLIAFPITGSIAFYYRRDLKKWLSARRFRKLPAAERDLLIAMRDGIYSKLQSL